MPGKRGELEREPARDPRRRGQHHGAAQAQHATVPAATSATASRNSSYAGFGVPSA
jgi:hypothetical protein